MLTSISPLGERARHNRWSITVSSYVASSVAAAAGIGLLLGLIGSVAGASLAERAVMLAVLAVAAAAADGLGAQAPGPRRQVDEDWLNRYRGWAYGAGFGAQLGAGVATIVTTATIWLYLAAALVSGAWWLGAAVGAAFGLARSLPLMGAGRVRSFSQLQQRHATLVRVAPLARRVTTSFAAAAAVTLVAVAIAASTAGSS